MRTFPIIICMVLFLLGCIEDDPMKPPRDPDLPVETEGKFKNPVLTSGADPWVIKKGNYYYVMHTVGYNLTLLRTEKMSELSSATSKVIWNPPPTGMNSQHIWAPEIHYIDGTWYVYYSASDEDIDNHKVWVISNSSPDPMKGTWEDQGELKLSGDAWAIDASVAEIDGKKYIAWSGWLDNVNKFQHILLSEMKSPIEISDKKTIIASPTAPWESNNTQPRVAEGPQFLITKDKVFIFYSAGACWTDGYALGYVWADRNSDLLNKASWKKSRANPVFKTNGASKAFGPGHNSFFTSKDGSETWNFYHANSSAEQGCGAGRSARIQPVAWEDGFPILGSPVSLDSYIDKPSGE